VDWALPSDPALLAGVESVAGLGVILEVCVPLWLSALGREEDEPEAPVMLLDMPICVGALAAAPSLGPLAAELQAAVMAMTVILKQRRN
jgi:hypothetical protein